MSGKKSTPDQSAQAVVLRQAGFTLPAIASRLGISMSTTQRIIKANKVVAGSTKQALIDEAREELLRHAFSLESVQQIVAAHVLDDLSLSQQIRVKVAAALDELDTSNPAAFRALAASSTALKLTQDVWRRALPMEKLNQSMEVDELPELQIHIMTDMDVAEMRAQQRREDAEISGNLDSMNDEIENLRWLAERKALRASQTNDDDIVVEG